MIWVRVGFAWLVIWGSVASAQDVVPDGTTATSANSLPDGSINVLIAPSDANGTSLNRYDRFSVPTPGVVLDNSGVSANLIINVVTSSIPSSITGDLVDDQDVRNTGVVQNNAWRRHREPVVAIEARSVRIGRRNQNIDRTVWKRIC